MKRPILLLALFLLPMMPAQAVEFVLTGRIVFEDGNLPLDSSGAGPGISTLDPATVHLDPARNIKVWVKGGRGSGRTDSDGRFRFTVHADRDATLTLKMEVKNSWVRVWADRDCVDERFVYEHIDRPFTPPDSGNFLPLGEVEVKAINEFVTVGQCLGDTHDNPVSFAAALNVNEVIRTLFNDVQANRDPEEDDEIDQVDVEYCDNDWNTYGTGWDQIDGFYIWLSCANYEEADGMDFGFLDETIAHEYGHHVVSEISSTDIRVNFAHRACTETDTDGSNDPEFAWSEGFPTYLAARTVAYDPHMNNTQRFNFTPSRVDRRCGYYGSGITWKDVGDEERWVAVDEHVLNVLWDVADGLGSGDPEARDFLDGEAIDGHRRILQLVDDELENWLDAPDLVDFYEAWVEKYGQDAVDGRRALDSVFNLLGIAPYSEDLLGIDVNKTNPFPFLEGDPQIPANGNAWRILGKTFDAGTQRMDLELAWSYARSWYPDAPWTQQNPSFDILFGVTNTVGYANMEVDSGIVSADINPYFERADHTLELPDELPDWLTIRTNGNVRRVVLPRLEIRPDAERARAGTYDLPLTLRFSSGLYEWRDGEDTWDVDLRLTVEDGPEDDPDGDGLSSREEIARALGNSWYSQRSCLSPLDDDSDDDGLVDGKEIRYGADPCKGDTDGDRLGDRLEVTYYERGWRCYSPRTMGFGLQPEDDFDGDGLSNQEEIAAWNPDADVNLNPCVADSDGDGIDDGEDSCPLVANADDEDQDDDGIGDACDLDRDGDGTPNFFDPDPDNPASDIPVLRENDLFFDIQGIGALLKALEFISPAAGLPLPPGGEGDPLPPAALARDAALGRLLVLDREGGRLATLEAGDYGLTAADGFGAQAQLIADRNGDGLPELAVTAPRATNAQGEADAGVILILSGADFQPLARFEGVMGGHLGSTLVDGDQTLFVGAPGDDANAGAVLRLDGLQTTHRWEGREAGDRFGAALALLDDGALAVGAPGDDRSRGALYRLAPDDPARPSPLLNGGEGERLGSALAPAPGGAVLVGLPGFQGGASSKARVRPRATDGEAAGAVILVDAQGEEQWRKTGEPGEALGSALASLGGQGGGLFLVGAPGADPDGRTDAGGAYLLDGTGNTVVFIPGEQPGTRLGARVGAGPDLDGDGLPALALVDASGGSRLLQWRADTQVDAGNGGVTLGGPDDKRCFIATAAWGSPQSPYVDLLRQFRDRYLVTHAPGRALVAGYYRLSPPFAAWLAEHDAARAVVRLALWPWVGLAWLAVYHPQGLAALFLLALGGWWTYRRRVPIH